MCSAVLLVILAATRVDGWLVSAMDLCPWSVVASLRDVFDERAWADFARRVSARLGPRGVESIEQMGRVTAWDRMVEAGPSSGVCAGYDAHMRAFETLHRGERRRGDGRGIVTRRRMSRRVRGTLFDSGTGTVRGGRTRTDVSGGDRDGCGDHDAGFGGHGRTD